VRNLSPRVLFWMLPMMLCAIPAGAQDEPLRISFGGSTISSSGNSEFTLSGSVGYGRAAGKFAKREQEWPSRSVWRQAFACSGRSPVDLTRELFPPRST
jgi:hypothetical protein